MSHSVQRLLPFRREPGVIRLVEEDPSFQSALGGDLCPTPAARLISVVLSEPRKLHTVPLEAAVQLALYRDDLEMT